MDSLPVELLRLIFQSCGPESVRNLRITCGQLAEVGYEYLIPPTFRSLPWRNDILRLHAIAGHERLRGSIQSVVLNFSQMDEYSGRHTSFFQHFHQDPEERNDKLHDAWLRYYKAEEGRKSVPPFDSQAALFNEALSQLPNLRDLRVTYTESPHDIEAIHQVFRLPDCHKMDRKQACADLGVVMSAISRASSPLLSSLEVDRLPLELFKLRQHRQHWFECGPSLSRLSRLSVTVDPSKIVMPNARFRAVNGLGHFLRFAANLQHLTLAFHNYAYPRDKFSLWFHDLFEDFVFPGLTDLRLEGVSCDEDDLKVFLARHGPTLERLHLGGIHLGRGTFKSLFTALRGKLPKLESVHLSGHFECGMRDTTSYEIYDFRDVSDDEDAAVTSNTTAVAVDDGQGEGQGQGQGASGAGDGGDGREGLAAASSDDDAGIYPYPGPAEGGAAAPAASHSHTHAHAHAHAHHPHHHHHTTNSLEFERYLLSGGEYPGSSSPSPPPSPQSE